MNDDQQKLKFNLQEAARQMASATLSAHAAEVMLAEAIEHGALHADIKRWATEQWEGRQLPGNLNRLETFIEHSALDAWLAARQPAP